MPPEAKIRGAEHNAACIRSTASCLTVSCCRGPIAECIAGTGDKNDDWYIAVASVTVGF